MTSPPFTRYANAGMRPLLRTLCAPARRGEMGLAAPSRAVAAPIGIRELFFGMVYFEAEGRVIAWAGALTSVAAVSAARHANTTYVSPILLRMLSALMMDCAISVVVVRLVIACFRIRS